MEGVSLASGALRVVSPQELQAAESLNEEAQKAAEDQETPFSSQLANEIHQAFADARNWRDTEAIERRQLEALRAYRGEYDATTLAEINQFGGSSVYARITESKCRAASALLRDIYLSSAERPWDLDPTPDPEIPDDIETNIQRLVSTEVATLGMGGQDVDPQMIADRVNALRESAEKGAVRQAKKEAQRSSRKLNDLLVEGGFYEALREFLIDLPIFLIACIKGPVIQKEVGSKWVPGGEGETALTEELKLCWYRVSPFDMYFSPGASSLRNAAIMERIRFSRDELYNLIGVPGYSEEAIRRVLSSIDTRSSTFGNWTSYFETERAWLEDRETPTEDPESRFIDCIEYSGYVRGQWLIDWGLEEKEIEDDPEKEYYVECWLIDRDIIKVHLSPLPQKQPKYYISSYEKIPGSIYGFGLPQILNDVQQVSNATLRALVNNLSIASGPQVVVDDDRLAPGMDGDSLYPWKRWHVQSDPYGNNQRPVDFYQPDSRSAELLGVFEKFSIMADEVSGIPRYMTGSQRTGGAASTASGLSMLINYAGKTMQQVAANIDGEVIGPAIKNLYGMVLTFYPDMIRGDEQIVVKGVTNAQQQEQDRVRQLEFMQLTSNPIDMQIMGADGRAKVLRSISRGLGMDAEDVIPEDEELRARAEAAMAGPAATGDQAPGPNASRTDQGIPRLDTVSNRGTQS